MHIKQTLLGRKIRNRRLFSVIQITLLFLFTFSSLIPPNSDATLCIALDSSIHMHLDQCGAEIEHCEQSHEHDIQEFDCNKLKMLCAIDPVVVSPANLKIKLKNSSDIFSKLYIATFQKPDIKICPTSLRSAIDIHTLEHLNQIKSIRLLI